MTPVERKNRRLVAENSKWKIFFDHIADRWGNEVHDYVVLAGQTVAASTNDVTGVAILPVIEGRVVLVRSYRHALQSQHWEVPHGFVDPGETAAEAALRELTEETGLQCEPADFELLGFYAPEASTIAARGALFVAKSCHGTLRVPAEEIGLTGVRSFARGEVWDLVARGDIEDAATLIAFYRLECGLGQRMRI